MLKEGRKEGKQEEGGTKEGRQRHSHDEMGQDDLNVPGQIRVLLGLMFIQWGRGTVFQKGRPKLCIRISDRALEGPV